MAADTPKNEQDRLAALRRFELLDTPPEPEFDRITRLTARLFKSPIALITLVDEHRQWFKSRVGLGTQQTPREFAFCAHAILQDDLFVVCDAQQDPAFNTNPLVTGEPHIRFYAGVPLRTFDGFALGTLCIIDTEPRPALQADEAQLLREMAAIVMNHVEARLAVGFIHPVTGLANRFRFNQDIDTFLADPRRGSLGCAVIVASAASAEQYADLLRLLGSVSADAFEVASAERIRASLPAKTKLYHLSAAHFGCVLPIEHREALEASLSRLASGLSAPILVQGIPVLGAVGIGVAQYPRDGEASVELVREAANANHQARSDRRPWCVYSAASDAASRRAFRLLRDLGGALAAGEQLGMVYQPKIAFPSGACTGVEALLRWSHPELGAISPAELIPLVERTALMRPLTEWVLDAVMAQAARWRAAGLQIGVSINISMLDLHDEDFGDKISRLLAKHAVASGWISLEVTESALVHDHASVARQLAHIRGLDIALEIDDFGTGQSALAYLKHIPASYVKIDRSFISALAHDATDRALVRSTIELAHELGLKVVAEGIETEAVYDWLSDHDCDLGQGYAIAKPLSAVELEQWLSDMADRS